MTICHIGEIGVELHIDKRIPLNSILKSLTVFDIQEIVAAIKSLIFINFPVDIEMTSQSSTSSKEFKDKEIVATALMQLMKNSEPILYCNEPKICSEDQKYIHGDLDILLGEKSGDQQHIVHFDNNNNIAIENTEMSETKSQGTKLVAKSVAKKKKI